MNVADENQLARAVNFARALDAARIHYRLEIVRDAIMFMLTVPGQRWEVEFFPDGNIEVERFISTGEIEGPDLIPDLLREHGND